MKMHYHSFINPKKLNKPKVGEVRDTSTKIQNIRNNLQQRNEEELS